MIQWAKAGESVTLRFELEDTCDFEHEVKRDVEGPTKIIVEEASGVFDTVFGGKKRTTKVVTTVTEWHWTVRSRWTLRAYKGADPETPEAVSLVSREFEHTMT